ncbi:MAG: DNA polymerase III subunit delta' [Syntrophobacteraceae bacterium]
MAIRHIPGQERATRFLTQMVRKAHVPHAFLFSGIAGAGKREMALELAKLLNCLAPEGEDCCDVCASCKKAAGGTHPDFHIVRAQGAFIKIDQVRELKERLRFRPFEARLRVIIIEEAQHLKEEAANAILKILEEPPPQNLFILTVLEPQMLLPTIVSRCCHIRFQPLEDRIIQAFMSREGRLSEDQARDWSALAGGSLERARRLAESKWIEHIGGIVAELERLCEAPMTDFFSVTAQWVKKSEDLEQDLECIKLLMCACVSARLHLPMVFPLRKDESRILSLALSVPFETLFGLYEKAEEAQIRLRFNGNKQLALEHICLAIREGLHGQSDWDSLPNRR